MSLVVDRASIRTIKEDEGGSTPIHPPPSPAAQPNLPPQPTRTREVKVPKEA